MPVIPSAFHVLLDRTLTVKQAGVMRDLTVEEALEFKAYEQALAGKRMAIRSILRMIETREKALAQRTPPSRPIPVLCEPADPSNAYDALQILGIAIPDPRWDEPDREVRLLLEPWAVQVALARRGTTGLSAHDISEITRCTHEPDRLTWPRRRTP
jgi:hypothetical protein